MATVVDIADEIYRESDSDTQHSIASIAGWLRLSGNIGSLNNLLHTYYSIDSTSLEIVDRQGNLIGDSEVAVYKQLYFITFYERKIKSFLGVGSVDQLLEATSDGGTLRFVNRNDIAKSYIQLKKDSQSLLDKLIKMYKFNQYIPLSVEGDDTAVEVTSNRIAPNLVIGLNMPEDR